eukprot:677363-Hanusia_phi.AAC.2
MSREEERRTGGNQKGGEGRGEEKCITKRKYHRISVDNDDDGDDDDDVDTFTSYPDGLQASH